MRDGAAGVTGINDLNSGNFGESDAFNELMNLNLEEEPEQIAYDMPPDDLYGQYDSNPYQSYQVDDF